MKLRLPITRGLHEDSLHSVEKRKWWLRALQLVLGLAGNNSDEAEKLYRHVVEGSSSANVDCIRRLLQDELCRSECKLPRRRCEDAELVTAH